MKFSQSARFFSSQLIFDFRHCEWAAYSRGVNLLFIPFQFIEAYKWSQGQSERRDTLICQCWLCCAAFIARVSKGAGSSRPSLLDISLFFVQPLDAEKYTGVEESRRKKRIEWKGMKKKANKSSLSLWFRMGFCDMSWDVTTHLSPSFSSPVQYYNFMVLFCAQWRNDCFKCTFLKRHLMLCVNAKLDLSKWK